MIGTIATDRSYQFLRVITRVGHTEGPQRVVSGHDVSGLNADIAMVAGRWRSGKGVGRGRREFPAYAVENQRDRVATRIYAAALIEFPVAIILLYTGRLAAQG